MTTEWEEAAAVAQRAVAEGMVPSVSMALATGAGPGPVRSFGAADRAASRPATADTPYSLASITKPIVATTALLLARRGTLDLDRPVADFDSIDLPGFAGVEGSPTVRETLQHRGGFGTHHDFTYGGTAPSARQMMRRYAIRYRQPGTAFEYSNLGYGLLELIIEEVCRQPVAEVIEEVVMEPLGITSFAFGAEGPRTRALRYTESGQPYLDYDTSHSCASLGWLTAVDLARFGAAHTDSSSLLDQPARRELHELPEPDADYALGWAVTEVRGEVVLIHGGFMGGTSALLTVVPARGLAAAVLINATNAGTLAQSVTDLLIGGGWPDYRNAPTAETPPPVHTEDCVGRWAGAIVISADHSVALTLDIQDDGDLTATVGAESVPGTSHPTGAGCTVMLPIQLPTPDARIDSPQLVLELDAVGQELQGAARALKTDEAGGRVGNCFSHWCSLRRAA